tara:strand:- start:1708 stop:1953 length:246 start_codon:yes stop_codon:yes gene_type:complete
MVNTKIFIVLLKYGWNVRRKNWWYRFPFIPIPPRNWLLWRFETAWGIDSRTFKLSDLPPVNKIIKDVWKFGHWLSYIGRYR